jgi:Family of unknown function (DUF5330)
MGFLIRTAFWLTIVILLIPADETETRKLADGRSITAFEAIGFATAAYQDARGFCQRNTDACDTGQIVLATFEAKARTGARWVYGFMDPAGSKSTPAANTPVAAPSATADAQQKPIVVPVATGSIPSLSQAMPPPASDVQHVKRPTAAFSLPEPPPRRPS